MRNRCDTPAQTTIAHWHSPTSANALLAGYTKLQPIPDQLTAWAAAAGIHIAAWRHSHRRRDGVPPWRPALEQARHWADSQPI
ncbi:hypothetical protein [Streptomyces syringium]|uniref:hypothetical protein n=1 Tax=Streptomyces syringium TaxID=76729 RepID=UPI0037D5A65E